MIICSSGTGKQRILEEFDLILSLIILIIMKLTDSAITQISKMLAEKEDGCYSVYFLNRADALVLSMEYRFC